MWKFRVQTIDDEQLRAASERLAAIAWAFKPDIIIGIRSGGYVVARAMASSFPSVPILPVTCRRAGTKKKQNGLLKTLMRKLPGAITARLRIVEHIFLTQLRPPKRKGFTPDGKELAAIEQGLRERGNNPNILIVDDSVDSGSTLAAVVETVTSVAGSGAVIKTAVITVTTSSPFIEPSFALYRYVLCRFPWSLDFKN